MFTHTNENREFWIKEVSLDADLIEDIRNSDILFLPVREYRNINNIFYTTAGDFFKYIKKQNDISVEICINDRDYKPISLNSREFILGTILIKDIVLPILVGIATNYFIENQKADNDDKVSISIIVEKKDGNYRLDYDGDINGFIKLKDKIDLEREEQENEKSDQSANQLQNEKI